MQHESSAQPWARKQALIEQSRYAKATAVTAAASTAARLAAANIEAASIRHGAHRIETHDHIERIGRYPAPQCACSVPDESRSPISSRTRLDNPACAVPDRRAEAEARARPLGLYLLGPRDGNGPKPCAHRSVADCSNRDRLSPDSGITTGGHPHLCR